MPDNNSSLKDFNTSAKRRGAELRLQHDTIGIPANKKELSRIAKDVEVGGPSLSNGYQREMVTTVQTLEGLNLPGKEFAAAVGKQLQEISNIYKSNPASEDDTPKEQSALKAIHRRLSDYARKRSSVGSRARASTAGLTQKMRGSVAESLGDSQNILNKALSALIRPRENKKIERQRGVAAAAMGSSQSAFGVHSPRKAGGDDDEWGGGDSGLGGGLGGDGGLGGGAVLTRLANIEDILHEIWQLADAGNTRGEEEAENAKHAEEERERTGERDVVAEDTSPERLGKENKEKSKSWLGALGGILLTVFTTLTGGIFKGFGGLVTGGLKTLGKAFLKSLGNLGSLVWRGMTGLGRMLMGPLGSLVRGMGSMLLSLGSVVRSTIAGILTWFTGGGLGAMFAVGGAIVGGWLASIGTIVSVAVKNAQIKKVYTDAADDRLATGEAAALGLSQRGPGGVEKSTDVLAVEAANQLLATEGGNEKFLEAMDEAGLDIDDINKQAGGFTAEQSQKLFRTRSVQRGKDDAQARLLLKRQFEEQREKERLAGRDLHDASGERIEFDKSYALTEDEIKMARGHYATELSWKGTVPAGAELGVGWNQEDGRGRGSRIAAHDYINQSKKFRAQMDAVSGQSGWDRMKDTVAATFTDTTLPPDVEEASRMPESMSPTRELSDDISDYMGGGPPTDRSPKENYLHEQLYKAGYSYNQAEGIIENLRDESKLNEGAVGDKERGERGSALGIAQWREGRRDSMLAYYEANKDKLNFFQAQVGFLIQELRAYGGSPEQMPQDYAGAHNWVLQKYEIPAARYRMPVGQGGIEGKTRFVAHGTQPHLPEPMASPEILAMLGGGGIPTLDFGSADGGGVNAMFGGAQIVQNFGTNVLTSAPPDATDRDKIEGLGV